MKNHIIIGTAGHIDHGKTALIKALTGLDTDQLKEEKERGITIDIGFAYWKENVTIIDVPGHEKFIRNMVAGVNTVDFFLLVIAADDGIMPQTIEHLDILNFFDIKKGIVVINKIDLVDEEWLMLIHDEVESLLKKYNMEDVPVIDVSAIQNLNIDELRSLLEDNIQIIEDAQDNKPFRLFVDRSFSIKGFGTVVTGTVLSGQISAGEEVEIYPVKKVSKIRGLQEHILPVEAVRRGDRAAINLQNIAKKDVKRGDVLGRPDELMRVKEFFGTMKTVSKIPVKIINRSMVRVHTGTAETIGKLIWYDTKKILEESEIYHVRIKLEEAISIAPNDPFLVRLHSPLLTLAGGKILETNPPKIKHRVQEWENYFKILSTGDLSDNIENIIEKAYLNPISIQHISQKVFEQENIVRELIEKIIAKKRIRKITLKGKDHFVHQNSFNLLTEKVPEIIHRYHEKFPLKPGLNIQEIIGEMNMSWLPLEIMDSAINKLLNSKKIKYENNIYSLPDFEIKIDKDMDQVKSEVLLILKKERFSPSNTEQLSGILEMKTDQIRSVIGILEKEKKINSINNLFFIHHKVMEELIDFIKNYFKTNHDLPVSELKEFIQTTRKFAIPIFEYLDSAGYTIRSGDVRKKGSLLE